MVPVEPLGEAVGVKTGGGVLEHVLFKVKVRCLAKDLPEVIHVDVTNLDIGKSVHLHEIKAPEGVEILGDKNIPVLTVAAPITEEQEAAAAAAEAAAPGEVEMIKEKKEEGAEAAPAAGKAAEKAPAGKSWRREEGRGKAGREEEVPGPVRLARPAWRTCLSSWDWGIRGGNMRAPGTTQISGVG
jgi:hypothetical protein